ncbi:hypothetical protein H7Q97_18270 [Ochrobactrum sp. CM-21-5]|nr:hypothetical protein [Ochrobactrum sp. CM-21-5]MBC2887329.1 hypothetical protein [Ochrobactrum sp. CM-21-5]
MVTIAKLNTGANEAFKNKVNQFLCDSPLYTDIKFNDDPDQRKKEVAYIRDDKIKIDIYCIYCKKESTFVRFTGSNYYETLNDARENGVLSTTELPILLKCQRENYHQYKFSLSFTKDGIQKIGQFPSMESISSNDIAKYRSVLDKQDYSELHRAGGLASHGIGIAPYVYLRRIFERLIYQHYDRYKSENEEISGFDQLRIDEKISKLADYLPEVLVKHKAVYKVLSKGIHELDEETCKKHYPVARAVIIAILEEDLQRKEKEKAATALQSALQKTLSELGDQD